MTKCVIDQFIVYTAPPKRVVKKAKVPNKDEKKLVAFTAHVDHARSVFPSASQIAAKDQYKNSN